MSASSSSVSPLARGRWIPWVLGGAFVVVLAVNATLLFLANATFGGFSTTSAYTEGLSYNHEIARAEAQERLGWATRVRVVPGQPTGGSWPVHVTAEVDDPHGVPISGLQATADLRRPADARLDRALLLAETTPGRWQGTVNLPAPGLWEIRFAAGRDDGSMARLRQRVVVPAP